MLLKELGELGALGMLGELTELGVGLQPPVCEHIRKKQSVYCL